MICAKHITGIACRDEIIKLTNREGRTLYYFENPERKRVTFNIPTGEWQTDNDLTRLRRPLIYVCPKLPKPDKTGDIKPLKYFVEDNPNKCSIDVKTGNVIIDKSIFEKDIPFLCFVLFHENGHFFYKGGTFSGEACCDIFAAKKMMERGYNPSQIYFAQEFCLSEKSIERKDFLYNWLKKVKCYE